MTGASFYRPDATNSVVEGNSSGHCVIFLVEVNALGALTSTQKITQ